MWETLVRLLGWEDPWRRERPPTPVFWPGESHGQLHAITNSWTRLSDFHFHCDSHGLPDGSVVKSPPPNAGDLGSMPGLGLFPPGEEKTTHFSILAWEMPWTEESAGCSSWGCKEAGHDAAAEQQAHDCYKQLRNVCSKHDSFSILLLLF